MARNPIASIPQRNTKKPVYKFAERNVGTRWIVEPETNQAARTLYAYVNSLIKQQGARLWANTLNFSMYTNTDLANMYAPGASTVNMPRMAYNLIKTDTDVVAGTLVQSNSRAVIETNEELVEDWRRAEKMQMAIDGEWARGDVYNKAQSVAIDGLNAGSGWMKAYIEDDKINFEHRFTNNVFVDEFESAYGPYRAIFEVRYVRKDVLAELYPNHADIIASCGASPPPAFGWTIYSPGMVMVVEGWAAPVGNRKGRHIIAVSSGSLVDEEWTEQYFPLIQFKVGDRPLNPYGQSYTEQVFAAQIYLNKMLTIMEDAANLGIAPFWVIGEGSGVTPDMMQNKTRVITATDPSAVQYHYQPPFHADAYTYTRELERYIHNFYGINQLQANTTDSGLNRFDSSEAMNAYIDQSDTRHIMLLQRWEQFFVELAKRTIMLAGQIAKKNPAGYPVLTGRSNTGVGRMKQLNWRDLEIENDAYRVTVAAANILGNTPGQRINTIFALRDKNVLSASQAQRLASGPSDVGAAIAEANAVEDYIDYIIDEMVDHGRYIGPTEIDDLPRMMTRIADARCQYITRGLPTDRSNLFLRWLTDANAIIKQAEQQAQLAQQLQQPPSQGTVTNAAGSATGPAAGPANPIAAAGPQPQPNPGPPSGAPQPGA